MNGKDVVGMEAAVRAVGGWQNMTVAVLQCYIPLPGDLIHRYWYTDSANGERQMLVPSKAFIAGSYLEAAGWKLVDKFNQEGYCRDVLFKEWGDGIPILEVAAKNVAPKQVLEYIYNTDPDSVAKRTTRKGIEGMLPLHLLCGAHTSRHQSKLDSMRFLLEVFPPAVKDNDNADYMLPLFALIDSDPTIEEVQLLVEAYPEALGVPALNKRGPMPLHEVCKSINVNYEMLINDGFTEILRYLVDKYPQALEVPCDPMVTDRYGYAGIPLDCLDLSSLECIMILVRPFPQALLDQDRHKKRALQDFHGEEEATLLTDFAHLAKREINLKEVAKWMGGVCDTVQSFWNNQNDTEENDLHECFTVFQQWAQFQQGTLDEELNQMEATLDAMVEEAKVIEQDDNNDEE